MASTLTNSTLTVTLTEKCIMDGTDVGKTRGYTVSTAIREFAHMFRNLAAAFQPLLEFKSTETESGSQFDADVVKYVRVTNLDDSAKVGLVIVYGSATANPTTETGRFTIQIGPLETWTMGSPLAYCFEGEGVPYRDVIALEARGLSGSTPDIEVVVGSA